MSQQYKQYYPQLDGLRFLLFIYIIVSHSYIDQSVVLNNPLITAFYRTGWIGVQGFFVLSGFIITHILLREIENHGNISYPKFYARRFLKIIPPFYFTIILVYFLSNTDLFTQSEAWNHLPRTDEELKNSLKELPYFLFLAGNIPLSTGVIAHTTPAILISWTLAIEEQFYLIQPVLLSTIMPKHDGRRMFARILWCCIGLAFLLRVIIAMLTEESFYSNFNNTFTLTQIDSICFGALIAISLGQKKGFFHKLNGSLEKANFGLIIFLIILSLGAISYLINQSTLLTYTIGMTLINIFFSLCIIFLISRQFTSITPNVFTKLGRNGYCLYLSHHIALILAYEIINPSNYANSNGVLLYWGRLLIGLFLSIFLAKIFYMASEAPFLKLRRSFH